jgi:hypothetical protein
MRTSPRIIAVIAGAALLGGAAPAPPSSTPLELSGMLEHGYYRIHNVTLRSGVEYTFVGACDRDCSDLDLQLFDENGNLIDEDLLRDDVPVVSVTPEWTGRFHVKVIMASCSISPCGYTIVA